MVQNDANFIQGCHGIGRGAVINMGSYTNNSITQLFLEVVVKISHDSTKIFNSCVS